MSTFTAATEDELVAGRLYDITLEFRENYGAAEAHLLWRSAGQPLEVVPSNRLFYTADPVGDVGDTPYAVTVSPHKPSQPLEVSLAVEAWDQVRVNFMPPDNDGGEAVGGYVVEWWSAAAASEEAYGSAEVQTLKIGGDVDGEPSSLLACAACVCFCLDQEVASAGLASAGLASAGSLLVLVRTRWSYVKPLKKRFGFLASYDRQSGCVLEVRDLQTRTRTYGSEK